MVEAAIAIFDATLMDILHHPMPTLKRCGRNQAIQRRAVHSSFTGSVARYCRLLGARTTPVREGDRVLEWCAPIVLRYGEIAGVGLFSANRNHLNAPSIRRHHTLAE
jgi:hypothetical protein